jgi:purine-binding chemotaxis protein CheW
MGALVRAGRAAEPSAERGAGQGRQYLTFSVANELYAIGIAVIKEIIEYRLPTEVPLTPAFVRGVINLRGRVVPVIDLACRFARTPSEVTRRSCIVILEIGAGDEGERQDIGVMVDAVSAVVEIDDTNVEPAPSFGTRLRNDFISGMGKIADRFVIILDPAKVLCMEELALLAGMDEPGAADPAGEGEGTPRSEGQRP